MVPPGTPGLDGRLTVGAFFHPASSVDERRPVVHTNGVLKAVMWTLVSATVAAGAVLLVGAVLVARDERRGRDKRRTGSGAAA